MSVKLGDFLGAILSEVTLARVHADLEAVRVAELYTDPMLKGTPIPRFRLPELNINIPVVINEISYSKNPPLEAVHQGPSKSEIAASIKKASVESELDILPQQEKELVDKILAVVTKEWKTPLEIISAIEKVRNLDRISKQILTGIKEEKAKKAVDEAKDEVVDISRERAAKISKFGKIFQRDLQARVVGSLGNSNRIEVLASTSDIHKIGKGPIITNINVKIREDGLESVDIENNDGSIETRLVPE
jgi:hypothetical protein